MGVQESFMLRPEVKGLFNLVHLMLFIFCVFHTMQAPKAKASEDKGVSFLIKSGRS